MSNDDLGDRMKDYERVEADRLLDTSLPVYARIDGRGFSKFTRGLARPYDARMSRAMIETTKYLVSETAALIGYTQSDEISLGWHVDREANPLADMFFGGKVQKLASVLSGMATAAFTRAIMTSEDPEFMAYARKLPHFDCRVFNVPDADELANAFLWRELDASRNAVQMAARNHFSANQLFEVNVKGMLERLAGIGIDFEGYPDFFKRGTFVRSVTSRRVLTTEELQRIPEAKRPDPTATFPRTSVEAIEMPSFRTVKNRTAVIYGERPVVDCIPNEETIAAMESARVMSKTPGFKIVGDDSSGLAIGPLHFVSAATGCGRSIFRDGEASE